MAKRNPKAINEKLKNLTKEQANALAASLNSAYPDKKKPADGKTKPPAGKKKAGK